MKTVSLYACLLLNLSVLIIFPYSKANQADKLDELILSRSSQNPPNPKTFTWEEEDTLNTQSSSAYVIPQLGEQKADRIVTLPGQPYGVNFEHYSGYVTVDAEAGRELFYYFVESPYNPSTKPLILWLNGGPGCSSLGYGAFEELGPFRVNSDGKTLYRNKYAWNEVANILFLESPAGVGFSHSNTTSDYDKSGDKRTAQDAYVFLINWLERFPQYKTRDFYITGESYAGHYVPQLASTILQNNIHYKQTIINLKGISIGNAWIDDATSLKGVFDYLWTHALSSDQTHELIEKYCDFTSENASAICIKATRKAIIEKGDIDFYNIYAPLCHESSLKNSSTGYGYVTKDFDPCSDLYGNAYLNRPEVQKALHAKPTNWSHCSEVIRTWNDSPVTILPTIKYLIDSGIKLWIYSGDTDAVVPVTSSRYSINTLKLPINSAWRPWYSGNEVGGYVVGYKGLTFVTVRGAGHLVPSWQPERALTLISSFIYGVLPPVSPSN